VRDQCRSWVKPGKAQCEHMFSALPAVTDIVTAVLPLSLCELRRVSSRLGFVRCRTLT
jgi:hypothetical protein